VLPRHRHGARWRRVDQGLPPFGNLPAACRAADEPDDCAGGVVHGTPAIPRVRLAGGGPPPLLAPRAPQDAPGGESTDCECVRLVTHLAGVQLVAGVCPRLVDGRVRVRTAALVQGATVPPARGLQRPTDRCLRDPQAGSSRLGHRPRAGASTRRTGALCAAVGGAQPPTVRPGRPLSSAMGVQAGGPRGTLPDPRPAHVCASGARWPHARGPCAPSLRPCPLVRPHVRSSGPVSAGASPG
jgi:hypothetical protein